MKRYTTLLIAMLIGLTLSFAQDQTANIWQDLSKIVLTKTTTFESIDSMYKYQSHIDSPWQYTERMIVLKKNPKGRPSEILTQKYNNNTWENQFKVIFTYYANQINTHTMKLYRWIPSTQKWSDSAYYYAEYTPENKLYKEVMYFVDSANGYYQSIITTYTYDSENNLIKKTSYGNAGMLNGSSKNIDTSEVVIKYDYNIKKDTLTINTRRGYYYQNNTLAYIYKYNDTTEKKYDNSARLLEERNVQYGESGAPNLTFKNFSESIIRYTYNNNGLLTEKIRYFRNTDTVQIAPTEKNTYFYNDQNLLDSTIKYSYSSTDNSWLPNIKQQFYYDSSKRVIKVEEYYPAKINWILVYITSYKYDNNGNIIEEKKEASAGNTFETILLIQRQFNNNNQLTYEVIFEKINNALDTVYKTIKEYTTVGNILKDERYNYKDTIKTKTEYYYSQFIYNVQNVQSEISFVYPNPANQYIYLNLQNVEFIEIYEITGKLITRKQLYGKPVIELTNLKPGTYIIKAKTKDRIYISKFIKQ